MFAGGRDSSEPVPKCPRWCRWCLMVPKCLGSKVSWVRSVLIPVSTVRTQDTSDPRHYGTSAEMGMILFFGASDFPHFLTWQHADTIPQHHPTMRYWGWRTWGQKRSSPCQALQVVSIRKMSPNHAFNGGSKLWQNLISISVQDYYRHTTTFCIWCQHLQPAFGFQLWWWGNRHLAQPISANGQ